MGGSRAKFPTLELSKTQAHSVRPPHFFFEVASFACKRVPKLVLYSSDGFAQQFDRFGRLQSYL